MSSQVKTQLEAVIFYKPDMKSFASNIVLILTENECLRGDIFG